MLAAKSSQQVDNKINQMAKATKNKATQANKPQTEEKFLSAKDLAKMANVKPTVLRRCLRAHFTGRISTIKGGNGLKTYQVKANDPIVKEVLAKLKGNGDKGKVAAKAEVKPVKAEAKLTKKQKAEAKKQAKVKAKQEQVLARLETETPLEEPPNVSPPFTKEKPADKGEGDELSPESQFNYKGYQFILHKDLTATVINPDSSISHHNSLANALHQRGFSFKQLEKEGVLPKELAEVK